MQHTSRSLRSSKFTRLILAGSAAALLSVVSAQADTAPYYWDDGTVVVDGASGGGTGAWTVGQPGWEDGTSAQNWSNGNDAVFGGTAGTVTLGSAISAGTVTINTSGYIIAKASNNLTIGSLAGTGNVTINGIGTTSITGSSAGYSGAITLGPGNGNNATTDIVILGAADSLGTGTLNARGAQIQYNGPGTLTVANTISNGAGGLRVGGTGSLTFTGGMTFDQTRGVVNYGSGLVTLAGTINPTSGQFMNVDGGRVSVTGNITGAGGVSVTGVVSAGDLTLSGTNNNYTGSTNVTANAGVGNLRIAGTVNGTSGVIVNSGTLTVQTGGSLTTGASGNVTSSGTLTVQTGGSLTTGTNGSVAVNAGTTSVAGSLTTTGTGGITVGSASAGTLIVNNGGTLTTTGALSLGAGNTSNVFTVDAGGTANVGSIANAWGTTTTVNGTLNVTGGYTVSTNVAKDIAGSGTINAASFTTGNASTTVNFTNTGSMNLTGALTLAGTTPTFNQSAGTIKTSGLALNGTTSSTYALTGGRINIGSGGITSTGGTKTVNLGAGTVGASANWSSSLNMALTNAATGTTFNTLDSADNTTARNIGLSGVLSGTGGLVKAGAGALTLSGANTYAGPTNVNGGSLVVSGSISSSSLATVNSGAFLNGSGTTGALTVASGGTVDAGNTASVGNPGGNGVAGQLRTGAFTLSGGAHLAMQIGGTTAGGETSTGYDQLVAGGAVTLSGGDLQLTLQGSPTFASSDVLYLLINNSNAATSGTFGSVFLNGAAVSDTNNINLNGQQFALVYNANFAGAGSDGMANDIALQAVPEPGTWAMMLGGLGMLLGYQRSRSRRKM